MKESREAHPIYIAVDSSKIARCKWCGVAESKEWQESQTGTYCSSECKKAGEADNDVCVFLAVVTIVPISMIFVTYPSIEIGLFFSMFLILLACPILTRGLEGWNYRKMVVHDSRRDERTTESSLLRTTVSSVSCPICNGDIDIRKVTDDRVYLCEYCGASGMIRIVETNRT